MTLSVSTGCFLNTSGYAQILGDDFNDSSLASPWVNLNSALKEESNHLEIKAQNNDVNNPPNIEGGIFGVAVTPTTGDYVQWTATYADSDDTCGSGLSISATEVDFDGAGQFHIFQNPTQMRVYLSGTQKYSQALTGSNDNVFRVQFTASGFDVYVNNMSAPVYQYTAGALTATYYFYACNVSPDNLYDFYIDNLSYNGYGTFSVHDSGQDYIYNALGQDFSTLDVTHSGATDIGLRYRSGSNGVDYGAWSGWYTVVEMQALISISDPYMQLEVRFKGSINAYISAVSIDGVTDTTAPGVPTAATYAANNTNNYGLVWTEPTDSDFSHCELRRVIGETTTYLGKNGSDLPEWQASPSTYWQFTDDDITADSLQSNYVDESVTGTPTYSVRSVDVYDNKSAWVTFTNGGGSTGGIPGTPSFSSATAGDTQVTLAITADSETDDIYVRYFIRNGDWSSESETFKRTGSGNVAITGLTNGTRYWFVVYAKSGDVMSAWSDPIDALPNDGSTDAPIVKAAEEIKNELNEASFSQTFTASRVYTQHSRLEKITDLEVWVQPVEQTITPKTRDKDQCEYSVDIGIFKRCQDDSEVDEMMYLADEIYRHFRRYSYEDSRKQVSVEAPTLYSPDYLLERGLFAAVITLNVMEVA